VTAYAPRPFRSTLRAGDRVWSVALKRFGLVDRDARGNGWKTSITFDGTNSSRYVNLLNLRFVEPGAKLPAEDVPPHDGDAPAAAVEAAAAELHTLKDLAGPGYTLTSFPRYGQPLTPADIEQLGRQEDQIAVRRARLEGLAQLCQPLMDYLRANHHPHTSIVIDSEHARLTEDLMGVPNRKPLV
jgi:hypothetical protein